MPNKERERIFCCGNQSGELPPQDLPSNRFFYFIFLYKREISQVKDVLKQRPLSLLSMVLLSSIFKVYLYL